MKGHRWVLGALLFASTPCWGQDAAQTLREGHQALAQGAIREALERYEGFADQGGLHPDVSYSRGVAYLTRSREGGEKPGDLGRAAAAFEEALLLRPEDAEAEAALEAVRAEVARRRARSGASPEVAVSPGALRAMAGLFPENGWAALAAVGSLLLSVGLGLRRLSGALRLAGGVALGLGGLLLVPGVVMASYARHLRQNVGVGVVVVDEARLVDDRGIPVPGQGLPEAARLDILERKGGLLRVRWGEVSGYTSAQHVRILGPRRFLAMNEPEAFAVDPALLERWVPEIPWLGVVVVELGTGLVQRGNDSFYQLLGYSPEELCAGGVTLRHLLTPTFFEKILLALFELKATGTTQPIEGDYAHRDGSLRHVWVTGAILKEHPGLVVAYILDQTMQRATMQALRESEERARRFGQASFEGLFVHQRGVVLDTNELLPAMFGTTREAMLGRHVSEFTDPECHPLMFENLARQYEFPYELVGRRVSGETFPIEVLGKPLPDEGRTLRVTAVRDISERKRTEATLREAEAALLRAQKLESLEVLAGGIAHDFNNLLAIIASHLALAQQQVTQGEDPRRALVEVDRAVARASDLSRQMLVYSGRSPRKIVSLQLNELIEELCRLLAPTISKKIRMYTELDPCCPPIAADLAQIEQVLLNLLSNAAEAIGPHHGEIHVKTSVLDAPERTLPSVEPGGFLPAGRYLGFEVKDTGCGMDAATLDRIFDPFFSTKQNGRGLGLSAIQGILRGHRGGLQIASIPGQGTSFRLFLPVLLDGLPSAPVNEPEGGGPARSSSSFLLIVDDERALRQAVKMLLEGDGYQVLDVSSGHEAVELLRSRRGEIALVLLDLVMPGMSGEETLDALRAIDPGLRVLLSSGFDPTETWARMEGKVQGVLAKPFRAHELLQAVQDALRG